MVPADSIGNVSRCPSTGAVTLEANVLSPADETSLIDLSFHWGSAYDIAVVDRIWTANPVGHPATILTADTADELRKLVRADYAGRPRVHTTPATSHLSERMST